MRLDHAVRASMVAVVEIDVLGFVLGSNRMDPFVPSSFGTMGTTTSDPWPRPGVGSEPQAREETRDIDAKVEQDV